jgi:MFS family permease
MFIAGTDCDGSYTSAMAASVTLYCSLIITIPGLLVIAFYGSFADRYGLKKTLMMPVLGNFMFCSCILLSLSGVMSPFYLHILLFGALCSGLSGDRNVLILFYNSLPLLFGFIGD